MFFKKKSNAIIKEWRQRIWGFIISTFIREM